MLTVERHDRIRSRLATDGRVLANHLAAEFGVSEDTVRRDLRELARAGECRRVYGGALAPAPDPGPIARRQTMMVEGKLRAAKVVAGLLVDGQTVLMDASSTNLVIAGVIPRHLALTIVTNAPAIALALADHGRCRTLLLGGPFDPAKGACLGAQAIRDLQHVCADLLILGACGIDARSGVTALDADEAELKRGMVAQSAAIVVAATADKIATSAPFRVAPIERVNDLVVPAEIEAGRMTPFTERGVRVHYA